MEPTKRFSVVIREDDPRSVVGGKLVRVLSGFGTRAEAETVASKQRAEYARYKQKMTVHVDEAHLVVREDTP